MPISLCYLAVFALAAGSAAAGAAESKDADAIRSRRAASNAAIAAHDADRAVEYLLASSKVIGSNGAILDGAAAMRAAFAKSFADPQFITYLRTPAEVEIGAATVAAETGRWSGSWRRARGELVISGTYLARWNKIDGVWKIAAENYVPLTCTGAADCKLP